MRKEIVIIGIASLLYLYGCGTTSPTLAVIGGENYTLKNFETDYFKSSGIGSEHQQPSPEERQKFLDLMINYKLKVKDARQRGFDRDSSVQQEINTYRASVAQSYALEKDLIEPSIKKEYDRKKEILRASHILLRMLRSGSIEDTLALYKEAQKIIDEASTVPFDSLVRKYSQDPSKAVNKGDLGYFSAGAMVPEFEDAVYALKQGEYTRYPVRTQFGYHIIKLTSRIPNQGSLGLAHILIKFSDDTLVKESAVHDSALQICKKINEGMPFEECVKLYSADKQNINNGGRLGYFDMDRLLPFLTDSLLNVGRDSTTNPIRFPYGYEIIKIVDRKPLKSFAEMEKDLKERYQQSRYPAEHDRFVDNLKKQYHTTIDSAVARQFCLAKFDSTKTTASENWHDTLSSALLHAVIIRVNNKPYTVQSVVDRISNNPEFQNDRLTANYLGTMLDKTAENITVETYALGTIDRYPELGALLREYEDGVLLYRIEQEEVWKKISVTDSLLRQYYEPRKNNYRWSNRVSFAEIFMPTDSAAKAVYKQVQKKKNFLDAAERMTTRQGYRAKKGIWELQPYTYNPLYEKASRMANDSITPPFKNDSGWSMIKVVNRDSAQVKAFEDVKGEIISGYQDSVAEKRKEEWAGQLREKYPVVVNNEILNEAFKKDTREGK